ncbi:MAG: hypothetical protein GX138_08820, partial [Firmicutes bacterium]|nr:hypothetical protein [Bacillota bacterium]
MRIKKTISFLLMLTIMLALVSLASASSFPALHLVHDPEIPASRVIEDPEYGRISPEYHSTTGEFSYFDFYVTATKATSGIRYRTPQLWIKVGSYPRFYFNTSVLSNWQPQGESGGQAVRVNLIDIYQQIISKDASVRNETDAAAALFSNDSISIGFKVEVYELSTNKIFGSAENRDSAINLLNSFNFSHDHIQDVGKMFQELRLMVPRVSAAYYEVKESPLYWGIEYQGKYYEWVRNITFDFKQAPGFGHDVTMNNIPTGKESLFSGYEFLCSGLAYPPDQTTVSISGKTSLTVKPTKEQSGIIARFYYIKHELPDFAVTKLTPGTEKTEPGKTYTGKATFALKGNPGSSTAKIPAEITITHNGYSVIAETKEFTPGLPQEISFNWTGQTSDSILRAEIWPTEPANLAKDQRDANPEDNVIEAKIPRVGYKLTVMKSGEGAITPSEGEHFYPANEKVNLIAVPDPGWKFVRWENDVSGTNPSTQVVMDKDKKVKAVFEK